MMDEMAEAVPPGSEGLVFHPFNHGGPYWNPVLRGAFYGFTLNHGKGHFFRAMLEGSTFCLKDSILLLRERIGRAPEEYRLVGGTKNRLWSQMICDISGMNGHAQDRGRLAGAAMMANRLGVFTDIQQAIDRCVVKEREVKFDPTRNAAYDRYHQLYKLVHDGLMENSRAIQATLDRGS
jgi:xylulokinase